MKAIRITADFSGYPDGKTERLFHVGEEPADLDDDYADLLVAKGLAEETASAKLERAVAPAQASQPAPQSAAPDTAPGTRASVPFMLTQAIRQQLRDLGRTDDEISRMTPAEAQDALAASQKESNS